MEKLSSCTVLHSLMLPAGLYTRQCGQEKKPQQKNLAVSDWTTSRSRTTPTTPLSLEACCMRAPLRRGQRLTEALAIANLHISRVTSNMETEDNAIEKVSKSAKHSGGYLLGVSPVPATR